MWQQLLLQRKLWKGIASMMVAIAHSDRSRDYTIPETGILQPQQTPGLPSSTVSWQSNLQAGSVYTGPQAGPQAPPYNGQMMGWDPSMQAGRPHFGGGASSAYPGQTLPQVAARQYPPGGYHSNSSAMTSQGPHASPYGHHPNASSPPGLPPAYYSK